MGIVLELNVPSARLDDQIQGSHLRYASLNGARRNLMGELGFSFGTEDHISMIRSASDDDILWHFFTASDCEAIFANWECHHLVKKFQGIHIEHHNEAFQDLIAGLKEADQRGYSLHWVQE